MSTEEANTALSTIPEEVQQQVHVLTPKSAKEIYVELAESRACYERGEYEDFDSALDDISAKYDL